MSTGPVHKWVKKKLLFKPDCNKIVTQALDPFPLNTQCPHPLKKNTLKYNTCGGQD